MSRRELFPTTREQVLFIAALTTGAVALGLAIYAGILYLGGAW